MLALLAAIVLGESEGSFVPAPVDRVETIRQQLTDHQRSSGRLVPSSMVESWMSGFCGKPVFELVAVEWPVSPKSGPSPAHARLMNEGQDLGSALQRSNVCNEGGSLPYRER